MIETISSNRPHEVGDKSNKIHGLRVGLFGMPVVSKYTYKIS